MIGKSIYDRYLERYTRKHTQCPHERGGAHGPEHSSGHNLMSERELQCTRAGQAETETSTSYC